MKEHDPRCEGLNDAKVLADVKEHGWHVVKILASGVAAVLHQRVKTLEQIQPDQFPCWTVLSNVQSLGNFGTLGQHIDPYEPVVVRATMGALFKQTLARTDQRIDL